MVIFVILVLLFVLGTVFIMLKQQKEKLKSGENNDTLSLSPHFGPSPSPSPSPPRPPENPGSCTAVTDMRPPYESSSLCQANPTLRALRWFCADSYTGECRPTLNANAPYSSLKECQNDPRNNLGPEPYFAKNPLQQQRKTRWMCANREINQCIPIQNPHSSFRTFNTYQDCINCMSCQPYPQSSKPRLHSASYNQSISMQVPVRWNCENDQCVPAINGSFGSQQACQAACHQVIPGFIPFNANQPLWPSKSPEIPTSQVPILPVGQQLMVGRADLLWPLAGQGFSLSA